VDRSAVAERSVREMLKIDPSDREVKVASKADAVTARARLR